MRPRLAGQCRGECSALMGPGPRIRILTLLAGPWPDLGITRVVPAGWSVWEGNRSWRGAVCC